MKTILLIVIAACFLAACKKETLKNNTDFQIFIGEWKNIPLPKEEQMKVIFNDNGSIIVKFPTERSEKFIPQSVKKETSGTYQTNGVFWVSYHFEDINNSGTENINTFTINPTHDTVIIFKANIVDFDYNNNNPYLTLVKTK